MTDRIPTLEELLNWSNSVADRKNAGEFVNEAEYEAAKAVFEYCLYEHYKMAPMQMYYMIMKRGDVV